MRTVLVTGGAGFIGSHLAEALSARGDRVRVLDNLSTGFRSNMQSFLDKIEFLHADLLDTDAVVEAVEGVECVFHVAALASVPRSVDRPLDSHAHCTTATVNLLDAARQAGVRRVVYSASSSAYGDQPFSNKRESDFPQPISPYAVAKLSGEFYCRAFAATYGIETVALRYFNVFGPRQDPNSPYSAVIPRFITALMSGQPPVIYGDGLQSRDFTFVANVVKANLLAAEAPGVSGRIFNAAYGRSTNLLTLLYVLGRLLEVNVPPRFDPPRVGDIRESLADITLARKFLGYEPEIDLEEGLRRSIEYYKKSAGGGRQ